jgi:hypothetical protein
MTMAKAPAKEDKAPAGEEQSPARKARKLPMLAIAVGLGVLVMEATTVAVMMWLGGGPAKARGGVVAADAVSPAGEEVEEVLLEGKAANTKRGTTYLYVFRIYALLDKGDVEFVKTTLDRRRASIEDIVRQVVARLDPKDLDDDPKLVTFRRVLMTELEPIFGANRIKQLLIPEVTRRRMD